MVATQAKVFDSSQLMVAGAWRSSKIDGEVASSQRRGPADEIRRVQLQGRINRAKYWRIKIGILLANLFFHIWVASQFSHEALRRPPSNTGEWILVGGMVAVTVVSLVVAITTEVKRFHDRDRSGWWVLLPSSRSSGRRGWSSSAAFCPVLLGRIDLEPSPAELIAALIAQDSDERRTLVRATHQGPVDCTEHLGMPTRSLRRWMPGSIGRRRVSTDGWRARVADEGNSGRCQTFQQ